MTARNDALEKVAHLRRRAYRPVLEEADGQPTDSKIGGTAYTPADAPWPNCGGCKRPMALLVQLNPAQLPEALRKEYGTNIVQLFYCLSSDPHCESQHEAWQAGSVAQTVRTVAHAGEHIASDPPIHAVRSRVIRSWRVADDYPNHDERRELGVELDEDEETALDETTLAGGKLAGWPMWVQGIEYPTCQTCGKRMRLVYQFDSDEDLGVVFGDVSCGHITACPVHKEAMAFAWAGG